MTVLQAELETPCCGASANPVDIADATSTRASATMECAVCGWQYEAVLTLRRTRPRGPRYPLAELERLVGHPSTADLARRTGLDAREVARYRTQGLTHEAADRAAVAFGLHPLNVWPSYALAP